MLAQDIDSSGEVTFRKADPNPTPLSSVPHAVTSITPAATEASSKYEAIADLDEADEEERWEERTGVITADQHREYVAYAADILADVVADVRTPVKEKNVATR